MEALEVHDTREITETKFRKGMKDEKRSVRGAITQNAEYETESIYPNSIGDKNKHRKV